MWRLVHYPQWIRTKRRGCARSRLKVGATRAPATPSGREWLERDGVRVEVAEVESRWREEERLGFRLRLDGRLAASCVLCAGIRPLVRRRPVQVRRSGCAGGGVTPADDETT